MSPNFAYRRQGRSTRLMVCLAVVYGATLFLLAAFDMVWWLAMLPVLASLPSLWEIIKNPQSGLDLTDSTLSWFTAGHSQAIARKDIEHVRFHTRWDFSVMVIVVGSAGRNQQIPVACLPPHRAFEAALNAVGIDTTRHHFTRF